MQIRQGDVLLVAVDEAKGEAIVPDARGHVLAEGEATGHAHTIQANDAILSAAGPDLFLRVVRPTTLRHQEHSPIEVKTGDYKVIRQREYTPEEIRYVQD